MSTLGRIIVVVAVLIAAGIVIVLKQSDRSSVIDATMPPHEVAAELSAKAKTSAPRLLDLGADRCVPCRMMAPILDEMKKEYAGKLQVQFIDVWKNPEARRQHGVRAIPTQIFYDASGKELFRHQGFMSKEDILAKWKELGFSFET